MDEQEQYLFLSVPAYVANLSRCWEKVLHLGEKMELRKGDIFTIGVKKPQFSYIKSGKTCCYVRQEFGATPGKGEHIDEIRFFICEGCLVRETFLVGGYGLYHTFHQCLTDVVMYSFDGNIIYEPAFWENHQDLIRNFIFSISVKSISAQLFSSLLKQRSNSQKIAYYIYGFYLINQKKTSITPPISQNQLSELLGISRVTVNRIIGKWKDEGILGAYTKNNGYVLREGL